MQTDNPKLIKADIDNVILIRDEVRKLCENLNVKNIDMLSALSSLIVDVGLYAGVPKPHVLSKISCCWEYIESTLTKEN